MLGVKCAPAPKGCKGKYTPSKPLGVGQRKQEQAEAKAKPAVVDDDEDVVEEPKKTTAKKAAPEVKDDDLSSIVDNWDDE